eukprot:6057960-Amphidinium_carterae.1
MQPGNEANGASSWLLSSGPMHWVPRTLTSWDHNCTPFPAPIDFLPVSQEHPKWNLIDLAKMRKVPEASKLPLPKKQNAHKVKDLSSPTGFECPAIVGRLWVSGFGESPLHSARLAFGPETTWNDKSGPLQQQLPCTCLQRVIKAMPDRAVISTWTAV